MDTYSTSFRTRFGPSFTLAEAVRHVEQEREREGEPSPLNDIEIRTIAQWFAMSQRSIDDFARDRLKLNTGSSITV